jgi:hypothetical protein
VPAALEENAVEEVKARKGFRIGFRKLATENHEEDNIIIIFQEKKISINYKKNTASVNVMYNHMTQSHACSGISRLIE